MKADMEPAQRHLCTPAKRRESVSRGSFKPRHQECVGVGVGLFSDKRVWQVDTFKGAQAAQRRLEFRREQLRRDDVRRSVETMGFFRAQPRARNLHIHPHLFHI